MNSVLTCYEYLAHHGIKGQHWGIRRYQNYDGSYTQAGMKRYNKSLEEYNKARNTTESIKKLYKNPSTVNVSENVLKEAKQNEKMAKKQLNKDYKHLRQDKLADQGKKLYAEGKTITGNSNITEIMSTVGSMSLSAAAWNYKMGTLGNDKVTKFLAGAGAASLTVAGAKKMADEYQAKRLRAYYSHTSNY